MNVRATLSRNWAIVVKPPVVERIWELLTTVGDVKASARCADDVHRDFENFASLAAFDNTSSKQIRSLQLTARSKDWNQAAHLQFGQTWETVSVSLEDPETLVSSLKLDLQDQLEVVKAWYSPVSRIDVALTVFGVLGFAFLVARTANPDNPNPSSGMPLSRALLFASTAVGMLGAIIAVVWCLSRVQTFCFPMVTFVLGQGLERYELQEKLR